MATNRWDQDAVAGAREGRAGAYARLVDRYTPPIRLAVYRIVRDHDQADDLTQQAFVSAWEHLDRFDANHRFFSWIYRIAVNRALNAARDGWRERSLEGLDPPSDAPDPEQRLLARERRAEVRTALATLPPRQRVLLALRYDLGLGCGEITRILDLPPPTVKARLHAARARLRRELVRREGRDPAP